MSQTLDAGEQTVAPEVIPEEQTTSVVDSGFGEFDYRPMPVIAPVAAVLGVCSLTAFLGLFGILLACVGIPVGIVACGKVLRSRGELSGAKPAGAGLALCLFSAVGGTALMIYTYKHEVPEGFERVSFAKQISENAFVTENGVRDLHPDVKALVGKPIFLKGFMYPTGKQTDLTEFLILKDNGQCCFGGQPALQDMIAVKTQEGLDVDYYPGRVSVAGTFKINPLFQGADPLDPLFLLEAEYFTEAKTAF